MPNFLRLHLIPIFTLIVISGGLLLTYLIAGDLKPLRQWSAADIIGEGGSAVLAFVWLCLMLKSRPAGRVTQLLTLGLGLMFLSWWADCLDEFISLPDSFYWDHLFESIPMVIGVLVLTYGLYHWHHEQLAISAQLQKRERLFREHLAFDYLTPLAGASYLKKQLALCLKRSRQDAKPLSLIIIDLNNFDAINQCYDHVEGDAVLQAVSQLLLLNLRQQDLLCRLAGDRFVVLLPNTGKSTAQIMANELSLALVSFAYKTQGHGERLHLSATTAVVKAGDEDQHQLLERLNLALARAKQPMVLQA